MSLVKVFYSLNALIMVWSINRTIKGKLVKDVFIKRTIAALSLCGRIKPAPDNAKEMKHKNSLNAENTFFTSTRLGKKSQEIFWFMIDGD